MDDGDRADESERQGGGGSDARNGERSDVRDAEWLRAALAAVRPNEPVVSVEPIAAGGRRPIVAVRFASAPPVVVRHGPDCTALMTESALLSAVAAETTVPVAEPLGWGPTRQGASGGDADGAAPDTADSPDDGGWLATRFVGGHDLHERFTAVGPAVRREFARAFGRFLGELHESFRFDGYGPVVASGGVVRSAPAADGGAAAWREWLRRRGHEGLDRLPSAFDGVAGAARDRLDAWTVDAAPTPRLYPWDLRPGNALVANGAITAVVDWESPMAAGAGLSVAKAEYLLADWYVPEEADALRRAFRAGYADVRPVPAVDGVHRIVAIAEAAVDSRGRVTNPRYPPADRAAAVAFHRRHLDDAT
jgi:hypothetical protein